MKFKTATAAVALMMLTGLAAAQSVGFAESYDDQIPDSFSGGDTIDVNTTVRYDRDSSDHEKAVPVIFRFNVESDRFEGEVPREAFNFTVQDSEMPAQAAPPCDFGDIFNRELCGFQAVPEGEHDVDFRIDSSLRLPPGQYNVSVELLSLEGEMYIQDLLTFWGDPVEVPRGERTLASDEEGLRDGGVEVDIYPEAPGPNGTDQAWVDVNELDRVLQAPAGDNSFVTGAQVLVNQDICDKSILNAGFLGNETPPVECSGGDDGESENTSGGIDTALVMDESGSMGWDINYSTDISKMDLAKDGAIGYVNGSDPTSRNAVVAFESEDDEDTEIRLNLTGDKERVREVIREMDPGGGTDIPAGVKEGRKALSDASGTRIMVLLSDGESDDSEEIEEEADRAREEGIEIHGIMYGDDASTGEFNALTNSTCETNEAENNDSDNCWYSSTEDISEVFGEVQEQINDDYVQNATESALFGGEVGEVKANGTIRFEYDRSEYNPSTVSIYRWNNSLEGEEPQGWVELETRNAPGGAVEADVESFSTFALFGRERRNRGNQEEEPPVGGGGGGAITLTRDRDLVDSASEAIENASEEAQNATEDVQTGPPEDTPGQPDDDSGTGTGQETGDQEDPGQQGGGPPGPTGFFGAGASDFVASVVSWITGVLPW